ncbi:MAG TPA: 2-polyprenyl-3-methyl-6-methoxy-1,4-benzoquinone monooxygenase [Povalibacter sp.]|nr:2-polyprenyl-3-methyl-6-methoxy-1,4-benzoquinone monooxygenase [Povalibacter sp.]
MLTASPPSSASDRVLSLIDRLVEPADQALRTLFQVIQPSRPYPAEGIAETVEQPENRREVASLMRVNHAGEVAAQALYQGQAFVTGNPPTRQALLEAGRDEADHLAWCSQRIRELGGRTSVFDPLWYTGSFVIGALAGLAGDRTSLGFVAETERQVVEHLNGHLGRLPHDDLRTRAILNQMTADEERHGRDAMQAGGAELPGVARTLMKLTAQVMTRTAYWL